MSVRYPRPLRPGDRVGVTSPSSGVPGELREWLAVAVRDVEARGYEVVVGRCMDGSGHVSAPAAERAAELTAMLTDPGIRAVVPPWGGETAIDLLPLIDWQAVRAAEPTWVVGYSDMSTVMTPLTLLTGVATVHGNNLMDTPYRVPDGLLSWFDVVAAPPGHRFTQIPPERHRASGWDDWAAHPDSRTLTLAVPGRWTRLDGSGDVDVEGRLIGGCIEMLCNLTGTPYLDASAFARTHAAKGLLVYVEAMRRRRVRRLPLSARDAAGRVLRRRERRARRPDSGTGDRFAHPARGRAGRTRTAERADRRRRRVRPCAAVPAPRQRGAVPGRAHRHPQRGDADAGLRAEPPRQGRPPQPSASTASISPRKSSRSPGFREVISGHPSASSRTTGLSTQVPPALVMSVRSEAYEVSVLPRT